jgi:hypothetical protein
MVAPDRRHRCKPWDGAPLTQALKGIAAFRLVPRLPLARDPLKGFAAHHSGAFCYVEGMSNRKAAATKSVRQSVTIPATLVLAVRRTAKEQRLTMSRALVCLAERGVRAEIEAREQLKSSRDRFLSENDPVRKDAAGKDLIRAIFGNDSIAEDSVREPAPASMAASSRKG